MVLGAPCSSFSRGISIIINRCVCVCVRDGQIECISSHDNNVKGHQGWNKWRLMVRQPADMVLLGGLPEHDTDKTDLQIVPSRRQCNLTWCAVFVSSPSGLPLRFHNGGKMGDILKFGTKRSSWQNVICKFSVMEISFKIGLLNRTVTRLVRVSQHRHKYCFSYGTKYDKNLIKTWEISILAHIHFIRKMDDASPLPPTVQKWS